MTKSGDERSDLYDRITCASNFDAYLTKCRENPSTTRVHGAKLQPHEMISKYRGKNPNLYSYSGTIPLDPVIEAQWIDLIERLKESGTLTNSVAMIDVSGSMYPDAIDKAVALGLALSEVSTSFKDRFLTFNTQPEWVQLTGTTLHDRVRTTCRAPWGGSTNITSAMNTYNKRNDDNGK